METETVEVEYKQAWHAWSLMAQNHFLKLIKEAQTLLLNPPKIMSPHNLRKVSEFLINYMVKLNFFGYSSTCIIFDHCSNQENEN